MAKNAYPEPQNPLILRALRLIEAFAKSDDERDFYLDRCEGFIVYVDLSKTQEALEVLESSIKAESDRYCQIPKLSFYETKKIMEGFVNEKVYDIDTKEKLLDIIQSKEARENFLEFIYDQHTELDKWQQFYQERSRIRIIEWLRNNHFHFVFEEDLELGNKLVESLKEYLFETKVSKDIAAGRKALIAKAKTYYSNEALNPRPKRGRPPKQNAKPDIEPQVSADIYTTVPSTVRPFLFIPNISGVSAATFSAKYESEEELVQSMKTSEKSCGTNEMEELNRKLGAIRKIAKDWNEPEEGDDEEKSPAKKQSAERQPPKKTVPKEPAAPKKKMAMKVKAKPDETKEAPPPPMRSIIKKEKTPQEKAKAPAKKKASATAKADKAAGKKRIIPKGSEKGKKPVKRIIGESSKKKLK